MKLGDLFGLYQSVKGYEVEFKSAGVGEVVTLTGYELRLWGGRWSVGFRRVR